MLTGEEIYSSGSSTFYGTALRNGEAAFPGVRGDLYYAFRFFGDILLGETILGCSGAIDF